MGFDWQLDRPFAVFDIESTGTDIQQDRIIDLAVVKLLPDGTRTTRVFRVNPGMPISPFVTAIHGITDADVANCPPFRDIARDVLQELDGCDLGGYNVVRFDIPMLQEEFRRAGLELDLTGRRIIDAQQIFHRREPRDLRAALRFYCGEQHDLAHNAEGDVVATIKVLEGQFGKYPDLPRKLDELDTYCNPRDPSWVDRNGRFRWVNNEAVVNFGAKRGATLRSLVVRDSSFLKWILKGNFPMDTKDLVRNALEGRLPSPPAPSPPDAADGSA